MTIDEIMEDYHKQIEKHQKRIEELKKENEKRCLKHLISTSAIAVFEFIMTILAILGYMKFPVFQLCLAMICTFCAGMAFNMYLFAKCKNTPNH